METTNTGDLSVYLAHSVDYEQITVSTVPAEKTNNSSKHSFSQPMGRAVLFVPMGGKFFRFLVIVKVFAGFCLRTRKKMV